MIINPYAYSVGNNCVAIQTLDTIYGTGTGTQFEVPFYGLYNYGTSATIMPQSSLGASKQIYRVGYYFQSFTIPYLFSNVKLYIGHVAQNEFPSGVQVGFSTLTITNYTKVYDGAWNVSANNTWIYAPLSTNFCYNGTSNIIIVAENWDGSWTSGYGTTQYSSLTTNPVGQQYRMAYYFNDTLTPVTSVGQAMTRQQRTSNIRLWY